LVLVVGVIVWLVVRSPPPDAESASKAARESSIAVARHAPNPMSYVTARTDTQNAANVSELITAYGVWASRSDTLAARKAIVKTLLGHANIHVGVEALLTAVDSDSTPRDQDPMWGELVSRLGNLWDAVTFRYGRDLVQIEARPKPRDLVLESLTTIRPDRLADDQKPLLASDFIDMYASLKPDQKPAVDRAMAALAGKDIVEIMAGRGLAEGSQQLQLVVERQRQLDHIRRHPVREAPAEE
jgi:hypothetical protein